MKQNYRNPMKTLLASIAFLLAGGGISNAQVTFRAVDGGNWGGNEQIDKLFDGTAAKWCTGTDRMWFVFEASERVTLTGYTIRTGSDNERYNGRNPYTWKIYGSNDDANHGKNGTWFEIHSVTEDATMEDENQQSYYFAIDENCTPYKYYKMEVSAVKIQDEDHTVIQIGEFIPSYNTVPALVGLSGAHYWDNNGPWTEVIDGNNVTKWMSGDTRNFVIVDAGEPIVLKNYMLAAGNDAQSYPGRNPVTWTISGTNTENPSNGADIWTTVVSVVNSDVLKTNSKPYYFDVTGTPAAYRYYRLQILAVESGVGNMFQLDEFALNVRNNHTHTYSSTYSFNSQQQQVSLCDVCNYANIGAYEGITIVDGKNFQNLNLDWAGMTVNYTRIISSNTGTVCLPYDMPVSEKTDATYYTLARYDSENDALVFDEVTGTLSAYTPALYILKTNTNSLNLNANSVFYPITRNVNQTMTATREDNSQWNMVGTMTTGTATEEGNSIYYIKGGEFYRCNGSINYLPYRAFFTGPADASGVKGFRTGGQETDVTSVSAQGNTEVQLFELSGRHVSNVRPGQVYIMNGRKVMFNK